jgi:hypothetical protein
MQKRTSPSPCGCFTAFCVIGGLVVVGIFVMVGVFSGVGTQTATVSKTPAPAVATPEPGSQWSYTKEVDGMGREEFFARVESANALSFGFPYQGSQHGTLVIRRSGHWGTNVAVRIERGQFLCGIQNCAVNVRFDQGPIQRFSASEPDDHSTTTLFLNKESRFISQLRKAKVARVEATFFQEGTQALQFNVDGFKWQ